MFEKGYKQKKIVLGFLRFCKYAFFKYLKKGISKKIVLGFLRFCKYVFFKYLEKCISKKIVLGFLRFCKYAFLKYLKKGISVFKHIRGIWVLCVCFLNVILS